MKHYIEKLRSIEFELLVQNWDGAVDQLSKLDGVLKMGHVDEKIFLAILCTLCNAWDEAYTRVQEARRELQYYMRIHEMMRARLCSGSNASAENLGQLHKLPDLCLLHIAECLYV